MKRIISLFMACLAILNSCQNELPVAEKGTGILYLNLSRVGVNRPATRAIDNDLALKILDSNGDVYVSYRAGSVPNKLTLEPGTFTVIAYTENQDTWAEENDGRGAACHYGTTEVSIEFDQVVYANMQVPMTNYAVTLTLPDLFHNLFKEYTFYLACNGRSVNINEGEKAYFSVDNKGFSYKLSATNTDNNTHSTTPHSFNNVENGKLYNITYYYGTDANSGGIDIEITDNMETEDENVPLAEND